MIKFNCPACGKKLSVPDQYANKKARCPGCHQTITIPSRSFVGAANNGVTRPTATPPVSPGAPAILTTSETLPEPSTSVAPTADMTNTVTDEPSKKLSFGMLILCIILTPVAVLYALIKYALQSTNVYVPLLIGGGLGIAVLGLGNLLAQLWEPLGRVVALGAFPLLNLHRIAVRRKFSVLRLITGNWFFLGWIADLFVAHKWEAEQVQAENEFRLQGMLALGLDPITGEKLTKEQVELIKLNQNIAALTEAVEGQTASAQIESKKSRTFQSVLAGLAWYKWDHRNDR